MTQIPSGLPQQPVQQSASTSAAGAPIDLPGLAPQTGPVTQETMSGVQANLTIRANEVAQSSVDEKPVTENCPDVQHVILGVRSDELYELDVALQAMRDDESPETVGESLEKYANWISENPREFVQREVKCGMPVLTWLAAKQKEYSVATPDMRSTRDALKRFMFSDSADDASLGNFRELQSFVEASSTNLKLYKAGHTVGKPIKAVLIVFATGITGCCLGDSGGGPAPHPAGQV